jgi:hypothetical protein
VIVVISNVTPALPPSQQNQLFGDDILLAIHTAKTSAIGEGDYQVFTYTKGGTYTLHDPETGILRVSVSGDWTNAGQISARLTILSIADPLPQFTTQGMLTNGQIVVVPVTIPAGVSAAQFWLGWRQDWGNYPTNDMDLILVRPDGTAMYDGATLNNPEYAPVKKPAAGEWLAILLGYEVSTGSDKYEFRVLLDGKVVK